MAAVTIHNHFGAQKEEIFHLSITTSTLFPSICHVVMGPAGFPGGSISKESACNEGELGSIPGLGRLPGGGHGNPLQYSCLGNLMDRGAFWAAVHGVTESDTTEVT